jgi:hypothetical protein
MAIFAELEFGKILAVVAGRYIIKAKSGVSDSGVWFVSKRWSLSSSVNQIRSKQHKSCNYKAV